jgi:flavin reductase (DIM6/NTAB) family NADH-FMN oxidoreductase RutF
VEGVFLRDGYLFLECELEKIVDGFGVNSLITGRVVAAHVREEALRASAEVLDDNELLQHSPLLAYLYPGRFTAIKETFSFPFPVDFKR